MDGIIRDFYTHSFSAYVREKTRIIIDCPGDACGIHPEISHGIGGYRFRCHNVDNMTQQLVLLYALAQLQTMARAR